MKEFSKILFQTTLKTTWIKIKVQTSRIITIWKEIHSNYSWMMRDQTTKASKNFRIRSRISWMMRRMLFKFHQLTDRFFRQMLQNHLKYLHRYLTKVLLWTIRSTQMNKKIIICCLSLNLLIHKITSGTTVILKTLIKYLRIGIKERCMSSKGHVSRACHLTKEDPFL